MTDKWPKYIEYRGITFKLGKYGEKGAWYYSYHVSKDIGGMGYLSKTDAHEAAEKAVDRMLEREAVK